MAFLESPRFPTNISFSSHGGPEYEVSVVVVNSGFEQRNLEQDEPLHAFDVSYGVKNEADLYSLLEFFHAVQGMTHEFRYKDWTDYKSAARDQAITPTDQLLGTGDASETNFQLVKKYTKGTLSNTRTIKKPVSGSVRIALDDVEQMSGWSVDTTTGIVTFTTPPGAGVTVKAGYEFDVPCRFDMKRLETSWVAWEAGRQDAVVKEVRL